LTTIISHEELLAPERHIFLSPHYDDIALSCGGVAALASTGGREAEVALIFGDHPDPGMPMTPFAESLHQQWGMSASEVIASRRAEESVAAAILGTTDRYLPFRDAIYRGERYKDDPMLFGVVASDEADLPEQILEAIDLPETVNDTIRIYAPLAIGHHVDHQQVFRVGVILADLGWSVWFYEDLPYALIPDRLESRLQAIDTPVEVGGAVNVTDVWPQKIDAIMAYPSQLAVIFGGYVGVGNDRVAIDQAMQAYARQVGDGDLCERFWRLRS
jgi:LmbE family N-acetylglucosaminyl deacetylase